MRACIVFLFIKLVFLFSFAGAISNPFKAVKCAFYECCQKPYIRQNFTKLEINLNKYLYGQPFVKNALLTSLKGHFQLEKPRKSLVLSFHGSTGVGKNFVSQFVAESLFERGVKSKYYRLFIATKDFPHNDKINEYKDNIKRIVEQTVKECENSLFVFDETDKIPIGLVDSIKAYIDYHSEVDGIDFRKSVFIFLSNSASRAISELTLRYEHNKTPRDKFSLNHFQEVIQNTIYYDKEENDKGMFQASIISSHLIDTYIPFLPLEKLHVKKCIEAEFEKYKFEDEKTVRLRLHENIDLVANELIYEPEGIRKFASSGCKKVPNLVRNLIVENQYLTKQEL